MDCVMLFLHVLSFFHLSEKRKLLNGVLLMQRTLYSTLNNKFVVDVI